MLKAYEYIFYRIFRWNMRTWNEKPDVALIASSSGLFISIAQYFVILTFFLNLDIVEILKLYNYGNLLFIILIVILSEIHNFYFSKNERFIKIFKEQEIKLKKEKYFKLKGFLILMYISFPFLFIIVFLPLYTKMNN